MKHRKNKPLSVSAGQMKTHVHTRITPHGEVWITCRRGNLVVRSLVSSSVAPGMLGDLARVRAARVDAEIRFICGGRP